MKLLSNTFILLIALAFTVSAPSAFAQIFEDKDLPSSFDQPSLEQRLLLAQKGKLTPSEAAKRAKERHGGKVVGSPRCKQTDSGTVCTVKLDVDGRIKTVTVRG